MNTYTTARDTTAKPEALLQDHFGSKTRGPCDAVFADSGEHLVAGVSGLPFRVPVMEALFANASFARYAEGIFRGGESLLVVAGERPREGTGSISAPPEFFAAKNGKVRALAPESEIKSLVSGILDSVGEWGGRILDDGSQVVDLKSPLPGPHFAVNLLLGNRAEFPYPLQTTPKSVVDRLGRGSFRSHAATQVLATRWDLRQEENGFPCNRQFYIFENGRQIFYSADPADPGVVDARCEHAQNRTVIRYSLDCGLEVTRTIFILPQEEGLPIAVEAQRIEIANRLPRTCDVRLVTVGMFGPSKPAALQEDVLYSTIIMESGLLRTDDGDILAVSPSYWPEQDRYDRRFNSLVLHDARGMALPREFSFDYTAFVGNGTLERPDGAGFLRNRQNRKGPGFFALSGTLEIAGGERAVADSFTGLVSSRGNPSYDESSLEREVSRLFARYSDISSVPRALDQVREYIDRYSSFLSVDTGDRAFSAYCSRNLPFQSLYQSFVSRSFAQTQKGYREIGFREIQDLFASMYYFNALGQSPLVRDLIIEWAAQVYEFGYANHNFFWEGKEAGKWSDDALWLHQAVVRYVILTDDVSILDAEAPIAGGEGKKRTLLETLKAALRYSTEISVGPHGIPLLDLADWNDCLKIDRDYASGPEKEKIWKATGKFESNKTESVMNGFLAVRAARDLALLAGRKGDGATANWAGEIAENLSRKLRDRAWVGRNYARLLINDHPHFTYAGADGDGLDTDGSGGTLFINSFSWSILAGVASEAEIKSMFGLVLKKLKTPFGLKLVSPMDLSRVVPGVATSEYFPGDRENGAVFKHAAMMAVAACFDAAKSVRNRDLARDLAGEAWTMLDLACPARAMADPFAIAGNPRFCTQYNNSETGENIGPLLSGTATWMILSLMKGFGLEYESDGLRIDPILRECDREVHLTTQANGLTCEITLTKNEGFARVADGGFVLKLDGVPVTGNLVRLAGKTGTCRIEGIFSN